MSRIMDDRGAQRSLRRRVRPKSITPSARIKIGRVRTVNGYYDVTVRGAQCAVRGARCAGGGRAVVGKSARRWLPHARVIDGFRVYRDPTGFDAIRETES